MSKRIVQSRIAARLAVAAIALAGAIAHAQDYPTRPVRLVVGFPPGGSNDIVARTLSPRLSELLGQQVIVENRAGANAIIGTEFVAKAAPDGYTLLLGSASPLVISGTDDINRLTRFTARMAGRIIRCRLEKARRTERPCWAPSMRRAAPAGRSRNSSDSLDFSELERKMHQ